MTNFICIFLLFRQKFLSYGKDRSSWGILFDIEREKEREKYCMDLARCCV